MKRLWLIILFISSVWGQDELQTLALELNQCHEEMDSLRIEAMEAYDEKRLEEAESIDGQRAEVGDRCQMLQASLQNEMQESQQALTMMSNLMNSPTTDLMGLIQQLEQIANGGSVQAQIENSSPKLTLRPQKGVQQLKQQAQSLMDDLKRVRGELQRLLDSRDKVSVKKFQVIFTELANQERQILEQLRTIVSELKENK